MSRRKKHEAHANHERWLVSYADFITLLFAFFVVMFAASQVDQRKVGRLALAVQIAFEQMAIFPPSSTAAPLTTDDAMPLQNAQLLDQVDRSESIRVTTRMKPHPAIPSGSTTAIRQMRKELEDALGTEIKNGKVTIQMRREGLVISLKEVGFFDSGSADLRDGAIPMLDRIAAVLSSRPYNLRIEGHTDNVPIHTARFISNWDLSAARAITIVSLFVQKYGISPERLSAGGYAEFHPVSDNSTSEGRAANRRVDVVVLAPQTADGVQRSHADDPPVERIPKPMVVDDAPRLMEGHR